MGVIEGTDIVQSVTNHGNGQIVGPYVEPSKIETGQRGQEGVDGCHGVEGAKEYAREDDGNGRSIDSNTSTRWHRIRQ